MAEMKPKPKQPEPDNITRALDGLAADNLEAVRTAVESEIAAILVKHGLQSYRFLILHDEVDSITSYHTDKLYAEATLDGEQKDVLLLVNSSGGRIEPAYLISKALKRLAKNKFVAVVPRRAKSAATLIALGADEIHMGMMSELGPIDPQINELPALSLGNALDVIAELVCKFPDSAALLGTYISENVPVRVLGYYQRVNESAVQYAERLLNGKNLGGLATPQDTANRLVNHYKDHSFVIDFEEAVSLLGEMVREKTPEYFAADEIFKFLDVVGYFCRRNKKKIWVVGGGKGFYWADLRDDG
ncbi:ATP-dependent Clp protease proteolytic subunit [Mesorhizobium sp. M0800]|uniref:SDH family Clp fold serine proteinase n=1 Tax=Mesorhizobium sp. M0800 TaxID=2957000 RepID=UPI00333DD473